MKTITFLFLMISENIFSQELIKIQEIFDFNIGDMFHFKCSPPSAFPSGDRVTVSNKYYSKSGDTLYYKLSHDRYSSTYISLPTPHMDYSFTKDTEILQLANLDSSLYLYDSNFINDTIFLTDISLCNVLSNGYEFKTNIGFDTYDDFGAQYGKGLGKTLSFHYYFDDGIHYTTYISLH